MSNTQYFWIEGEVREYQDIRDHQQAIEKEITDFYCVDLSEKSPDMRYGVYRKGYGWKPMNFQHFPREFRMSLLLMGVT